MVSLCWRNFIRVASRREPPAPRELDREERSGSTWPNQSRLGSNLAVFPNLRRTWVSWLQLGPNLSPTESAKLARVGPNTTHGEHCSTRSVIDAQKKWEIPVKTRVFRISDWAGHIPHFEAVWTSTWAEIASKWVQLAPFWSQVGPKLEPCWPKLAPRGADVAAMSNQNNAFGQCWADMEHVQITAVPCTFWRRRPGKHAFPPSWTYHSLLNYHASAPSVPADFCAPRNTTMFIQRWTLWVWFAMPASLPYNFGIRRTQWVPRSNMGLMAQLCPGASQHL